MRFLLVALLFAISYAQTVMYASVSTYNKASAADAATACAAEGKELCTAGQLFNAVFNEGWGDLCYSGWIADTFDGNDAGWFNANGNCGTVGWNTWTPTNPGSHCCDAGLASITPQTCASFDAGTCLAQGDKIITDDAASTWCVTGTCDIATCCKDFVAAPEYITLPENFPKYIYATAEDADAACQTKHPDLRLCTKNQVRDVADQVGICASGWWITEKDENNDVVSYGRGWYVGEDFKDSCNGNVGEQTWVPGNGQGAAHCCVPSYMKSGYRVLGSFGEYNLATAEIYCAAQGYSFAVCSKDQVQTISLIEMPNICMSGFMSDAVGWWQGDIPNSGCGPGNTFSTWVHPTAPGAHCCLSYVKLPVIPLEDYGILPMTGFYGQSTFSTGSQAEQACIDIGYDQLCSMGQQAYVEENPSDYGDIACKVGWVTDGDGYDSGFWGSCGTAGAWNNVWQPAGNPVAHCCFSNVPAMAMIQYPYYNGNWDTYATQAGAAAQCSGDYSLCSKDQLQKIATVEVTYQDVAQIADAQCRLGWTSEGEKGWWQGAEGKCGATGWRSSGDETTPATFHCCLPFEANLETTEPPTPISFIQQPERGYPYSSAAEALAACQHIHADYSLCADYEIIQVATVGVTGDENFDGVDPQSDLCYSAWTDPDRSQEYTYGWYVSSTGTCSGGEGWKSWQAGGTNSGAFCCYAPNFHPPTTAAPETTQAATEAPETSDASTETPETSGASTETPQTSEASTKMPETSDASTKMPETSDASTKMPETSDASTEMPETSDASTEMPETSDASTETPETSDASTETPETSDVSTETPQTEAPDPSDTLPSTMDSPSDCVDTGHRIDGFPHVNFCSSGGTVYLNGRDTCVPSGGDETEMFNALQSVWQDEWYLAANGCEADKTYEEATSDQLWITNELCNNLEEDITELESSTSDYMSTWTQAVIDLVNAQKNNFNSETQQALDAYLSTLQDGQ